MQWPRTVRLLAREAARQKCQGVVALNVSFYDHGSSPPPLFKAASWRVTQSSPPRSEHPQTPVLCHANRSLWYSGIKTAEFFFRKKALRKPYFQSIPIPSFPFHLEVSYNSGLGVALICGIILDFFKGLIKAFNSFKSTITRSGMWKYGICWIQDFKSL